VTIVVTPTGPKERWSKVEQQNPSPKVTFYDIEAELPPGCKILGILECKPVLLRSVDGRDYKIVCDSPSEIELFAAVALARWDNLFWNAQPDPEAEPVDLNDDSISDSEEQMERWRRIHAKAIENQKP
jgi:hypothetical protein